MTTGVVKFFNVTKRFGFIHPDDESKDVFVHETGLIPWTRINEGDKVEYELGTSDKGPIAVNVKLAGEATGGKKWKAPKHVEEEVEMDA